MTVAAVTGDDDRISSLITVGQEQPFLVGGDSWRSALAKWWFMLTNDRFIMLGQVSRCLEISRRRLVVDRDKAGMINSSWILLVIVVSTLIQLSPSSASYHPSCVASAYSTGEMAATFASLKWHWTWKNNISMFCRQKLEGIPTNWDLCDLYQPSQQNISKNSKPSGENQRGIRHTDLLKTPWLAMIIGRKWLSWCVTANGNFLWTKTGSSLQPANMSTSDSTGWCSELMTTHSEARWIIKKSSP